MPVSDWTPELREVAALIRARTKDRYGNEVGTFTVDTPVKVEVAEQLIREAVGELAPVFGSEIPDSPDPDDRDRLRNAAKSTAALLGAMNIEMSMFPEQVQRNMSPYAAMERRYERVLRSTREAITEAGGEGSSEETGGSGGSGLPSYEFEEDHEVTTFGERF